MITLKQEVVDTIKDSQDLRNAIQSVLGISHTTMYKYLKLNDKKLANANVIQILRTNTDFKTDSQILAK
jgi:hypothetical protein